MSLVEFLADPYTQAIFWLLCVLFSVYFAFASRVFSFGKDAGTKAWIVIAFGLFLIGVRVSFKVLFASYSSSYVLQILRFSIGIVGVILLYYGFVSLHLMLKRMYGGKD